MLVDRIGYTSLPFFKIFRIFKRWGKFLLHYFRKTSVEGEESTSNEPR